MSDSRRLPLVILLAITLTATSALAVEPPVLELEVSPSATRVGDRVRVMASARGGGEMLWGELTVAIQPGGAWELVEGPTGVPGARPPAWELTLVPMELGELELPAITVSARPAAGDPVDVAAQDPPMVTIASVLPGEEEAPAPAPIRDPIGVRGLPWEWILPVLGLLLPLLLGAALWWRGRGQTAMPAHRALPPLEEIEALAAELETRVGREPADGICDRLAAGLRRYLERRTGEPAEEMTSFELRVLARRRGWPEAVQRLVQQIMGVADGVRFGRRPSNDEEMRRVIGLVLETARAVESFHAPAESEDDRAGVAS